MTLYLWCTERGEEERWWVIFPRPTGLYSLRQKRVTSNSPGLWTSWCSTDQSYQPKIEEHTRPGSLCGAQAANPGLPTQSIYSKWPFLWPRDRLGPTPDPWQPADGSDSCTARCPRGWLSCLLQRSGLQAPSLWIGHYYFPSVPTNVLSNSTPSTSWRVEAGAVLGGTGRDGAGRG